MPTNDWAALASAVARCVRENLHSTSREAVAYRYSRDGVEVIAVFGSEPGWTAGQATDELRRLRLALRQRRYVELACAFSPEDGILILVVRSINEPHRLADGLRCWLGLVAGHDSDASGTNGGLGQADAPRATRV